MREQPFRTQLNGVMNCFVVILLSPGGGLRPRETESIRREGSGRLAFLPGDGTKLDRPSFMASLSAARKLDMMDRGVIFVRADVL